MIADRISPWSKFQDMGMKNSLPTFVTFIERIRDAYPDFTYTHIIEPRMDGTTDRDVMDENRAQSNEALRKFGVIAFTLRQVAWQVLLRPRWRRTEVRSCLAATSFSSYSHGPGPFTVMNKYITDYNQ
ncbi:hypothetical protein EDB87DRAFT_465899 [Lactarius vividus]|nr:hypothetical protein EDB87DRAFT_465899 [Lactarius vividus]